MPWSALDRHPWWDVALPHGSPARGSRFAVLCSTRTDFAAGRSVRWPRMRTWWSTLLFLAVARAVAAGTDVTITLVPGDGVCGETRATPGGPLVRVLPCGRLVIGAAQVALDAVVPDGTTLAFRREACGPTGCRLIGVTDPARHACSEAGCPFGPPLPSPNGTLTSCTQLTLAATLQADLRADGAVTGMALDTTARHWVTGIGNVGQPCPRCETTQTPTPEAPQTGRCDRGARAGLPCVTSHRGGLSSDCLPSDGGAIVSTFALPLGVLSSDTQQMTAGADGRFCSAGSAPGCFGSRSCRLFEVRGRAPMAPPAPGAAQPLTLASHFCVASACFGNTCTTVLRDDLPGPGALSFDARIAVHDAGATCGNGIVEPGEECDDRDGCCDADCRATPRGAVCGGASRCRATACDGAGGCTLAPATACAPGRGGIRIRPRAGIVRWNWRGDAPPVDWDGTWTLCALDAAGDVVFESSRVLLGRGRLAKRFSAIAAADVAARPATLPLTVIADRDGAACWATTFDGARRNDARLLRARSR